jgi:hypothetical protein
VLAGQTNNAYASSRPPSPRRGAPAQRGRDDLVVFVLEGELALRRRLARDHRAPAGACAFVPRGTRTPTATPARARARVLVSAPGAAREGL